MPFIHTKQFFTLACLTAALTVHASSPSITDELTVRAMINTHSSSSSTAQQPTQPTSQPSAQPVTAESNDFKHFFERGGEHFNKREFDEALKHYKRAAELNPNVAEIFFNMGVTYTEKGDIKNALECFAKALTLNPNYAKAYINIGKINKGQERYEDAAIQYRKALLLEPENAEARLEYARVLVDQQQHAQALTQFDILLAKEPNHLHFLFERANTLNVMNRTQESLDIYLKLLETNPFNESIMYNIAYTLKKLGRIQDAMPYYHKVLAMCPDHTEANFSLGLAYLSSGDFKRGWEKYEWRWKRPGEKGFNRLYPQPLWDGSDLTGKTIFLYAEQGLGDTFQFIRYARVAKERGGTVIVAVQRPLKNVIALCPYIDKVILLTDAPPHFDTYAPLMSLPYIVGTTIETVPTGIPYLHADPVLTEQWRKTLAADKNFKIGICWQGNDKYATPFLRAVVAEKSVTVDQFAPIAQVPGVSVYSLQQQTGVEQLNNLSEQFPLKTFSGDFDQSNGRFMDTVAVIKNLDLIITVDTSIAHVSAGLGIPTWTLLPNPPDWRWMLNTNATPWYPNMRLFRQQTPGDWPSVINTIVKELRILLKTSETVTGAATSLVPTTLTHTQELYRELQAVEMQLRTVISELGIAPDSPTVNDTFMQKLCMAHVLNEMRTHIQKKIALLS